MKSSNNRLRILTSGQRQLNKMRIGSQKEIFEIEKKLKFIEDDVPEEEQAELANLQHLDLNQEATLTNER